MGKYYIGYQIVKRDGGMEAELQKVSKVLPNLISHFEMFRQT